MACLTKDALILDVIYEKDDSLSVVYKKDNYYVYDNPTSIYVKGSASIQRITIDLPQAEKIENIGWKYGTRKSFLFTITTKLGPKRNFSRRANLTD